MAGKHYVGRGFYEQRSHFANCLSRMYGKYVRYSLVSLVYYGPIMVGPGENFSKLRFSEGSKALFSDWFLQMQ